ncbi:ferredoxin [Pseudonocardia kujensis]|uniref:ferredoxin n=1 Tax=Pseudonocardia kujensis TaxID=1128675 RepID=UPI001E2A0143|nr:ferredoxin [Pseudonocardia kujensis]MCE0765068.1 ferredoxin [Pseudonocardia kujensis]
MNIQVDADKCIASGACAQVCPEVFDLDDEGVIVVLDAAPPAELRAKVEEAAAACPAAVIEVHDQSRV